MGQRQKWEAQGKNMWHPPSLKAYIVFQDQRMTFMDILHFSGVKHKNLMSCICQSAIFNQIKCTVINWNCKGRRMTLGGDRSVYDSQKTTGKESGVRKNQSLSDLLRSIEDYLCLPFSLHILFIRTIFFSLWKNTSQEIVQKCFEKDFLKCEINVKIMSHTP